MFENKEKKFVSVRQLPKASAETAVRLEHITPKQEAPHPFESDRPEARFRPRIRRQPRRRRESSDAPNRKLITGGGLVPMIQKPLLLGLETIFATAGLFLLENIGVLKLGFDVLLGGFGVAVVISIVKLLIKKIPLGTWIGDKWNAARERVNNSNFFGKTLVQTGMILVEGYFNPVGLIKRGLGLNKEKDENKETKQ